MDVEMKRVGGIQAARRLGELESAQPKVLMASLYADDHLIAEVLRAGAMGYVLKTCLLQDLADAAVRVVNGGQFVSRKVAVLEGVPDGYHLPRIAAELKRRLNFLEHRLMALLGEGLSDAEAARHLGLSASAFDSLAEATAFRFGLDSRQELIGYARWDVTGRGMRQSQAGSESEAVVA
jgi:DNA-binding NarL/FixJ family response regulator